MKFGFSLWDDADRGNDLWTQLGVVVLWPLFALAMVFEWSVHRSRRAAAEKSLPVACVAKQRRT